MEEGLSDAQPDLYQFALDAPGFRQAAAWIDLFERVPAPSPEDLAWASEAVDAPALTLADQERLRAISEAFLASRDGLPPPSAAELSWALGTMASGEPLNAGESARLQDICARFWIEQRTRLAELLMDLPGLPEAPSDQDRAWARGIYHQALTGATPSAEELRRFLQIRQACPDLDLNPD